MGYGTSGLRRRLPQEAAELVPAAVAGGLLLLYRYTLAPGVTWANHGADSGDLITAAATLGVPHPSGYPTYILLARLAQLLPLGDLATRTTLLSALAMALAALVLGGVVRDLLADDGGRATTDHRPPASAALPRVVAAGLTPLAFGLAPLVWSQAVIAEVYALNALFAALLLRFTVAALRGPAARPWPARCQALAAGLALGNHLTIGLLVAAWLGALAAGRPARAGLRAVARTLPWLALGLLVYLYLPLAASAGPPVSWGHPVSWAGFWWVVSGVPYRPLAFGVPPAELGARLGTWAALLRAQFGLAGLALGCLGLGYGAGPRGWPWLSAAVALGYSAVALGYATADSAAYLIPALAVGALWIGLGAHRLLAWASAWRPRLALPAALVLVGLLLWPAPATLRAVDASQDRRAIDFAAGVLASAPAGAVVLTSGDEDTFPLWYAHYAAGQRPDVAVVVEPLLDFGWYRAVLRATYPERALPDGAAGWAAGLALAGREPGRVCATVVADGAAPLRCGAGAAVVLAGGG